jgi:hypothetical protein
MAKVLALISLMVVSFVVSGAWAFPVAQLNSQAAPDVTLACGPLHHCVGSLRPKTGKGCLPGYTKRGHLCIPPHSH